MKISLHLPQKKKVYKKQNFSASLDLCWNAVLFAFFTVVIASFVFGFYMYIRVNKEPFYSPHVSVELPEAEHAKLNRALSHFNELEAKSAEIKTAPAAMRDPSI